MFLFDYAFPWMEKIVEYIIFSLRWNLFGSIYLTGDIAPGAEVLEAPRSLRLSKAANSSPNSDINSWFVTPNLPKMHLYAKKEPWHNL